MLNILLVLSYRSVRGTRGNASPTIGGLDLSKQNG